MTHTVQYIEISNEKDQAYEFDFGGGHKEWLPMSLINIDENEKTVTIPDWVYESKFQ